MLKNDFFDRDPQIVAKDLLGKVIHHIYQGVDLAAMIIETEAYYLNDKSSHASLGWTEKRQALFMPSGTLYMYYARGSDSLNVSCQGEGNAVLLKAGVPYQQKNKNFDSMLAMMQQLNPIKNNSQLRSKERLCSGQTLLCRSLHLKVKDWDKKEFKADCFWIEDVAYKPKKIIQTTRLGISEGRDEHLPYRFVDYNFAAYATQNPLTKRAYQYVLSSL